MVLIASCGGVPSRHPAAVRGGVPATGPGFPVERADPSPQDLQLSGSVKGYVTQARAVCVQLAPPPEAEYVAQLLLELKPGPYLLVLAVRPYIGPGSYADGGARPASGEPVATITLSRWRTPPTYAPSRPTRPSSFTVDGTGLAGRLSGQGIPAAGGKVSISGSWNCLPLR